ncbi:MAG TPA: tetratricopeptide repeat protein [Candidatus Edwardsbacteria bacterium]|nr:tetratricopeptide repeat protein [Candidatus Edwardsbacteria bacterium]
MNRIAIGLVMAVLCCRIGLAQKDQAKKQDAKGKAAPAAAQAAPQPDPVRQYLQQPSNQGYLKARAKLDTLLARNPKDYPSLIASLAVERTNLAAQVNDLYAIRDSLDAATKYDLAEFLLSAKDDDRAIAICEQLNAAAPRWSDPWRSKGQALYQQGKLDEAERALLKAVEAHEARYDAYVWLARVRSDLKRYDEALETLKQGFAIKYRDIVDPIKDLKVDDDIKLMDELLLQNMVQPDQVEAERNKIIKACAKTKRP